MTNEYTTPAERPLYPGQFPAWQELACPIVVHRDGILTIMRPYDLAAMWSNRLPADQVREVTLMRLGLNPKPGACTGE